ncbi:MAG: hypothetical protein QUU85_04555, partial [Candidatus Eisenbacteria bacterium]|nr:hypothetical protein [Candidatus Eisenbacteria bacterium]
MRQHSPWIPARLLPSRDLPNATVLAAGLAIALLGNVAILLALPRAHVLLALAAGVAAALFLIGRLSWSVALLAIGAPLLDPITVLLRDEAVLFYVTRLLVAGGAAWLLFVSPDPIEPLMRLARDRVFQAAVLLGAVLFVRAIDSPAPEYARWKMISYAGTNLLLFAGGFLALAPRTADAPAASDARLRSLLRASLAFAVLMGCVALLNWPLHFHKYGARLTALGINPVWMARTMGLGILIAVAFRAEARIGRAAVVVLSALLGLVLVLAGSRAPLAGTLLAVALFSLCLLYTSPSPRDSAVYL